MGTWQRYMLFRDERLKFKINMFNLIVLQIICLFRKLEVKCFSSSIK